MHTLFLRSYSTVVDREAVLETRPGRVCAVRHACGRFLGVEYVVKSCGLFLSMPSLHMCKVVQYCRPLYRWEPLLGIYRIDEWWSSAIRKKALLGIHRIDE